METEGFYMAEKRWRTWETVGLLVVLAAGNLLHFVYDWTGQMCIRDRGSEIIIPGGTSIIQEGDHVVVVTNAHTFDDLGDILA